MADGSSEPFRLSLLSSINDLCDTNIVAEKLDDYISQACKRTFNHVKCKGKYKSKAPKWYDAECKAKRALAIRAGERVTTHIDKERQIAACRSYRACKQRKERAYTKKCVNEIRHAFHNDRGSLWRVLDNISNASPAVNSEPSDSEFYHHFKNMSTSSLLQKCEFCMLAIMANNTLKTTIGRTMKNLGLGPLGLYMLDPIYLIYAFGSMLSCILCERQKFSESHKWKRFRARNQFRAARFVTVSYIGCNMNAMELVVRI